MTVSVHGDPPTPQSPARRWAGFPPCYTGTTVRTHRPTYTAGTKDQGAVRAERLHPPPNAQCLQAAEQGGCPSPGGGSCGHPSPRARRVRGTRFQGYLLLTESSITFLMLCCSHSLCWSSSLSFSSRSSISAFRHRSLSTTSFVLQPAPTPLQTDGSYTAASGRPHSA